MNRKSKRILTNYGRRPVHQVLETLLAEFVLLERKHRELVKKVNRIRIVK